MALFWVFVAITIIGKVQCQVDIVAPEAFRIGQDDIEIWCAPSNNGSGLAAINSIKIFRNSSDNEIGTPGSQIVAVTRTVSSQITWQDTALEARSTVEGNIDVATAGYLRLRIRNTRCEDSTVYRCHVAAFGDNANNIDVENDTTVHANVSVGESVITHSVEGSSQTSTQGSVKVTNTTVLSVSCTAKVGSPPSHIRWCLKREQDSMYHEVIQNVTHGMVVKDNNNCQNSLTSELMFEVTNNDTDSMLRCEVATTSGCQQPSPNYAQLNIHTVDKPSTLSGAENLVMTISVLFICVLSTLASV